jgi:hypothetical protein
MCYLSSQMLRCTFYTISELPGRLFRRDLKSETVGARAAVHAPGTLGGAQRGVRRATAYALRLLRVGVGWRQHGRMSEPGRVEAQE